MFTHEDLIKFYLFHTHYNKASNNIGVIEKEKFNRLFKMIKQEHKNNPRVRIMMNSDKTKFSIFENEMETTYVLIQEPIDLRAKYFRKYI